MSEVQLSVASLGARETIRKIKADVVVTEGDDTTSTLAVVFDRAFVDVPEVIGVVCVDEDVIKGNVSATAVTATGLDANIYQVLTADVASGTYTVEITLAGKQVA